MAKPQKKVPNESVGTPTSIIVSVLCAILVYSIEELKASILLDESFPLRSVLLLAIGLGLTLCFFWRRLPNNVFRMASAGIYLFGLWIMLFFATLGPILLQGEAVASRFILCQQFGLVSMGLSSLALMTGFLGQQKPSPGLMASGLGAILLMGMSGFGFLRPGMGHSGGGEVLSAKSLSSNGHGEGHAAAGDHEETLHSQDHGHADEHGSGHGPEAGHDEHAAEGNKHSGDHGENHGGSQSHDAAHGADHTPKGKAAKAQEKHGLNQHEPKKAKGKGMSMAARSLHGDEEEGHKAAALEALQKGHAHQGSDDSEHADEHAATPSPAKKAKGKRAQAKAAKEADHNAPHWTYEGVSGPRYWADLSEENHLCKAGKEQSPIDIPASWPLMEDISLDYRLSTLSIVDNGHTIQFNPGPGNAAVIAGKRYQLMQFHIHAPSEHKINGHEMPLEIHFVHKDAKGQLAVIGVLVEKGKDGSRVFDEIWSFAPQSINNPTTPKDKTFNILALLPSKLKAYRYKGSLTTPPCSENVLWSVAAEPIRFSEKQIKAFEGRYRNNARPVQQKSLTAH